MYNKIFYLLNYHTHESSIKGPHHCVPFNCLSHFSSFIVALYFYVYWRLEMEKWKYPLYVQESYIGGKAYYIQYPIHLWVKAFLAYLSLLFDFKLNETPADADGLVVTMPMESDYINVIIKIKGWPGLFLYIKKLIFSLDKKSLLFFVSFIF